jgi:hypothetical protein
MANDQTPSAGLKSQPSRSADLRPGSAPTPATHRAGPEAGAPTEWRAGYLPGFAPLNFVRTL